MSVNVGEKMQDKINQYMNLMKTYQDQLDQARKKLNELQKNIDKQVLGIASNRNLSTKDRTIQIVPLMEKQDRLKEFEEDLEASMQTNLAD